jgi:hypothetical protein
MRVAAHGLAIDAPRGWEARVFRRPGAAPVLHVASFALHRDDGDYGAAATGRMRGDDVFAALLEFRVDDTVQPGVGLFEDSGGVPVLRSADFAPSRLQVTRAGQLGCQRFFSSHGRPFCLYAVVRPARRRPARLVRELRDVLATLEVQVQAPSAPGSSQR